MIKVKDLPQSSPNGVFLYCLCCNSQYSADGGDYFMRKPETVMTCCEEPLQLIRERKSYEVVDPKTLVGT